MFHLYLEKRLHQSWLTRLSVSAASVGLALVIGGIFLFASGINVVAAYQLVWTDVLTQSFGWEDLLVKMTPLLLTGTAVALAAQMKLWNIGAEGQLYLGATASTWVALHLGDMLPMGLALTMMLLAAMTFGGLWAFIPGVESQIRRQRNHHHVAAKLRGDQLGRLLAVRPVAGPGEQQFSHHARIPPTAQLPYLGSTSVHLGLVFGPVVVAIVLAFLVVGKAQGKAFASVEQREAHRPVRLSKGKDAGVILDAARNAYGTMLISTGTSAWIVTWQHICFATLFTERFLTRAIW